MNDFMPVETSLDQQVLLVARLLRKKKSRLVLAESCTGGLLAAAFTEIPGISRDFCGSHVVYREDSKIEWLGVKPSTLKKHTAVSRAAAEEMVRGVLKKTPEARVAGAITGYLGPAGKDIGLVFISVLVRGEKGPTTMELDVSPLASKKVSPTEARLQRRELAAIGLLLLIGSVLSPKMKPRARKSSLGM